MPLFQGTAGADTLRGSNDADVIDGGGGDDLIHIGGASTIGDSILGGSGDDRFLWQQGEGFARTSIDGGAGRDTIDFTGHEGGLYFRTRSLTLRDGADPNTIEGHVSGYNGLFSPALDAVFFNAAGIERIIASDVTVSLGRFTQPLEVVLMGGGASQTGSGDDTISLQTRVRSDFAGNPIRTLYPSSINGGAGSDTLKLERASDGYLFQQTESGWTLYDGSRVHQLANMELVSFAGGAATSMNAVTGIDFDAEGYLGRYADLRAVFGTDVVKAYQHYQAFGMAEGRLAGPFDALSYIASYPDLLRAFGANASAGAAHYVQNGVAEGRVVSFDGAAYAATYVDLARIIGSDVGRAVSHYITNGFGEGRAPAGFDSVAYLLGNPDLAGRTPAEARSHWLSNGADEGRVGDALFGREQTDFQFPGDTVASRFETAGDRDWYAITLPVYQNIVFNGSAGVTGLALYTSTGRLIASDADGRDFRVVITNDFAFGPAQYYLVATSTVASDYSISRTISPLSGASDDGAEMSAALALSPADAQPYATAATLEAFAIEPLATQGPLLEFAAD